MPAPLLTVGDAVRVYFSLALVRSEAREGSSEVAATSAFTDPDSLSHVRSLLFSVAAYFLIGVSLAKRRGWDSNPRDIAAYTLSRRA